MEDSDLAREVLQYRIIAAAFKRSMERELVVKGGFALRLAMNSLRVTKDIDLQQSTKFPLGRLQSLMRHAINEGLTGSGLKEVKITEPKQTETTARWKINGVTAGGSNIHLTIEVSRRDNMPSEQYIERVSVPPEKTGDMRIAYVDVYNKDAIAAAKVLALLGENRVVARDIFDLDFLIKMQAVPPAHMIESVANPKMIARLYQKIDLYTWDMFCDQVLSTIDEDKASLWDEAKFEDAKFSVLENVEGWLTQKPSSSPSTTSPVP